MPVVIACPSCKQKLKAPDAAIGKAVKCPGCGGAIKVPAQAGAGEPTPAPRQPAAAAKAPAPPPRRPEPEDDFEQEEAPRGKGRPDPDEDEDRPRKPAKAQDEDLEDEDQPRKPAAWLGLCFDPETDDLEVTEVTDKSPAAKAKLKVGDVIARLDGKKVAKRKELADFLHKKKPGDTIGIEMKGDDEEIEVKLAKRPAE